MGIQSASAAFSRFFVPETITEDFWGYLDERLKAGIFKECTPEQEQSAGFSSWSDFFECSFDDISYHKGEYAAFHFRQDQRRVPSVVVKQHVREAIQKYRMENNGKWPPRQERLKIQEEVQSWLLGRALPQPSACEVVWNPAHKWLLLGSTSLKVIDAFLEVFEQHFHLYPIPLFHANWALHKLLLDDRQKDVIHALVSVKSPQALAQGRFLGCEFLTWLWFFSERSKEKILLSDEKDAELHLGERMVLSLPDNGKERVICTTQDNALYEARTALQQGKLVQEMQLFLRVGENEYTFTLDATLWTVKGLKTPKQLPSEGPDDDEDGAFLEKMYFLEEVFAALDWLYTKFLTERLGSGWESDALPLLKDWIGGKAPA